MRVCQILLLMTVTVAGVGCADPPTARAPTSAALISEPSIVVLGSVQDGGLPHAACSCPRCVTARDDPAARRHVASLALVLPPGPSVILVDATPDLREQLDALRAFEPFDAGRVDRTPLDGVLLTHAHIGHYLGLAWLGFEAVATERLPVWASPSMASFLRQNAPWSRLVGQNHIDLRELPPGGRLDLGAVTVVALAVPHRAEFTDTLGFIFEGPQRRVLYVPDTDDWNAWTTPIESILDGVDAALLDGTFFSAGELPGRDTKAIGHPTIRDSMERLAEFGARHPGRIRFIHLNHSNPALDPASAERREIERRGFRVASEGEILAL